MKTLRTVTLLRFINQDEAKAHVENWNHRFDDDYVPVADFTKWSGDSFGQGFCFFVIGDRSFSNPELDIIEHYKSVNTHLIWVRFKCTDEWYDEHIGYGYYNGMSIAMSELHCSLLPYANIKSDNFIVGAINDLLDYIPS